MANNSNYDYLRRKGSTRMPIGTGSSGLTRKPVQNQQMTHSTGTVDSYASYSGGSANTNLTEPCAYSKKFVVVGDGGCGKTCLLISYTQGEFPEKYVPTVFENYTTMVTHKPSGKGVELALWDTAGQEEYDRLRPLSYPETNVIFVCFAIDCPNSLENVMDKWYPEVIHFCPTTPIILCGLKADLRHKRICIDLLRTQGLTPVTEEQGHTVARRMNAVYMECSSKDGFGVADIFDKAIDVAVGADEERRAELRAAAGPSAGGGSGQASKKKTRSCKFL